jgi:hypothetical protein
MMLQLDYRQPNLKLLTMLCNIEYCCSWIGSEIAYNVYIFLMVWNGIFIILSGFYKMEAKYSQFFLKKN